MTYISKLVKEGKKPCQRPGCDFTIKRKKYDCDSSYNLRRYCGGECKLLDKKGKLCQRKQCTSTIPRRLTDSDAKYQAREFCSTYCEELATAAPRAAVIEARRKQENKEDRLKDIKDKTDPISLFLRRH